MTNPYNYRPASNIAFALAILALCIGLSAASFYEDGVKGGINSIFWSATFCWGAFLIFIKPKVVFFDEGIRIINPITEHLISWGEIEEIDVRYTMFVLAHGKRIHAWAAPGPGRYHARNLNPNELVGLKINDMDSIKAGESPRTLSGAAVHIARLRQSEFQSRSLTGPKHEEIRRQNNLILLGLLLGTAFLTSW